jgi:hypothetical protein
MKEEPNQPAQTTPGLRPSVSDLRRSAKEDMKFRILTVFVALTVGAAAVGAWFFVQQWARRMTGDDAVMNELRNLSAIADEYYAKNSVTTVRIDQLDPTKLYNAGFRRPISKIKPAVFTKGEPLKAPSFDGHRVITFPPHYPVTKRKKPNQPPEPTAPSGHGSP